LRGEREFMAALMTSVMGNSSKVASYIQYCRKKGIEVLPPDVNESYSKFTVVGNKIRFGLAAVKNVGTSAIQAIIQAREEKGKFVSFLDFCQKVDVNSLNKRMVESLIKCGAFDSIGIYRSQLMAIYERTLDGVYQDKKRNIEGQVSMFEKIDTTDRNSLVKDVLPNVDEFPRKFILSMEKEMTGVYISGHPLDEYEATLNKLDTTLDLAELNEQGEGGVVRASNIRDGSSITIGGIVIDKNIKSTRNNNIMAFVTLEDLYGTVEVIVFPTVYQKYYKLLDVDSTVIIQGKVSMREEEDAKILCDNVTPLTNMLNKKLYIKISKDIDIDVQRQICPILMRYRGSIPVYLYMEDTGKSFMADRELWIREEAGLLDELYNIVGKESVKLVG
ncbi:MAG TPA: DNA polymerase III subunit alpha, partial [Clostridiales bacterium]|nr:DNA polymerase III subunit alpha [Clostridiales bacterium]